MTRAGAAPGSGHTLRVIVDTTGVILGADCHEPLRADCKTTLGGCLVAEQADEGTAFAEYHDRGAGEEPLADGMRIVAGWSSAEGCYEWRGYLEDSAGGAR